MDVPVVHLAPMDVVDFSVAHFLPRLAFVPDLRRRLFVAHYLLFDLDFLRQGRREADRGSGEDGAVHWPVCGGCLGPRRGGNECFGRVDGCGQGALCCLLYVTCSR